MAIEAPEVLVVGLGRQLRSGEAQGPRARLGAGALEALQRRYGIQSYFDADVGGYMGTCKASLDKSGRAGVQTIHLLQPVVENDSDVGSAMYSVLSRPDMDKAMVLFVVSDNRLPFGQLRIRSNFDREDHRLLSAHAALGPDNRVTCLHIGAGRASAAEDLLAAEVGALPRILANAATAIEVYLSEADLGLVMRFVNRPEIYEMPVGWPYQEALPAAAPAVEAGTTEEHSALPNSAGVLESYNMGSLFASEEAGFALFDLNRENATEPPESVFQPMSPQAALVALAERPPVSEGLCVAGRRFGSLDRLQRDLVELILEQNPGNHLRLQDDEDVVRTLLRYHPDGDRLLEDLVAVKVDCSPVDDSIRCLWVIKFDGYEEDVSLKTCMSGLKNRLELQPPALEGESGPISVRRLLGAGRRGTRGVAETPFERAKVQETMSLEANK